MERATRQRTAIREALAAAGRPLLPEEVLEAARAQVPALGIATVYRTLKLMRDEGELRAVQLPAENARYEIAGHGHHHHFQCRQCERVFDVHACPGDLARLAPQGFTVEDHELTLYGRCGDCRAAEPVARPRAAARGAGPLAAAVLALASLFAAAPAEAHKAHVHGVLNLDVAVEGGTLTLMLTAPMDSLVGFEHRPRTPAQRQAADAAQQRLRDTASLFKPAAAAGCRPEPAEVDARPLMPADPKDGAPAQGTVHADVEASYRFACATPAALSAVELGLFTAFPRADRIEVQVAGAQGQRKLTLRRGGPARVPLAR